MKYEGLVLNLDEQIYHAQPEISKHGLDLINKCPAVYNHYRTVEKEPPTPAMVFGSLAHKMVVEDREDTLYAMPKIDRRTKEGKTEYEYHAGLAQGKTVVSPEELATLRGMRDAVRQHTAQRLFDDMRCAEASLFWNDQDYFTACRGRTDMICHDGLIVDYKTTDDCSEKSFLRSVVNFRYHVQAAFYVDGLAACGERTNGFAFIAQEKKPPYLVAVYILPKEFIEIGRQEYKKDLRLYQTCFNRDSWPGYNLWKELEIPTWLRQQ